MHKSQPNKHRVVTSGSSTLTTARQPLPCQADFETLGTDTVAQINLHTILVNNDFTLNMSCSVSIR